MSKLSQQKKRRKAARKEALQRRHLALAHQRVTFLNFYETSMLPALNRLVGGANGKP